MRDKEKLTEAEASIVDFCMRQMEGLSDAEWREHGFRLATYERACFKVGAPAPGWLSTPAAKPADPADGATS